MYIYKIFVVGTILLSLYSTYYNRIYKEYILGDNKSLQYELSREIIKKVPLNKKVYIADIGLLPQYYLTNLLPPNLDKFGYSYGLTLNNIEHIKQINDADFVLKFKKEYPNYFKYDQKLIQSKLLENKLIEVNNYVNLYMVKD